MRATTIPILLAALSGQQDLPAQRFPTNHLAHTQAIKIASRLRRGIPEQDVARVLDDQNKLKCGGDVGDNIGWTRLYLLSDGCFLNLEMDPKEVTSPRWGGNGLLRSASIQSNGVKVVSIILAGAQQESKELRESTRGFTIPHSWNRRGLIMDRQKDEHGSGVSGDPCIVWDDLINGWRMVLFHDPPGHGQAICLNHDDLGPGQWKFEGPLSVANPKAVGGFHKPFIVMDPDHPNQAAKIDGRYCLLVVNFKDGHKRIQRAWCERLAGPWDFEPEPIIPLGADNDFDAKHTDAVTGYYFPKRKEFLYFYMGYPAKAQPRKISPFGSAQAVATQKLDEKIATKSGVILEPCQQEGHWASGWVGGLQLLRGVQHRWIAVLNASPTAPDPGKRAVWTEEPAPSLGGFAWCDEEWPTRGWHFAPEPIEWVKDIPKQALDAGEGYNLWRQFIHILPDGRAALFYNSGYYGREQLYLKVSDKP